MKLEIEGLEFEPFIAADEIAKRVRVMGAQLNIDYAHTRPVIIGVLNGSFMFIADLIKQITIPCEVTFTKLASYYGGLSSTQKIREDIDISVNIEGRDIILVEDIVETGNTLNYLIEKLQVRKPASIAICSLLSKPAAHDERPAELKYIGFEIGNDYVVGYGLDYQELGRNLKEIYRKV
ncbi:hypoxanthine phosphoribosyltransferase [Mucilaginibacter hurinus]|uniref:Hypoxanthine phosphoribosyltransferase n=1 Tax=Mucilaginibacter hurinus TaxID=2201324 RepID=A0A367GN31_9SPHI|nr:hypoxanthine phosphoribosyltransferase [Mucilaginibacter hurinus]RCH54902.1 hypoxanthine phosphoribosyltransferase [Mucilaginibacter hurinus]